MASKQGLQEDNFQREHSRLFRPCVLKAHHAFPLYLSSQLLLHRHSRWNVRVLSGEQN